MRSECARIAGFEPVPPADFDVGTAVLAAAAVLAVFGYVVELGGLTSDGPRRTVIVGRRGPAPRLNVGRHDEIQAGVVTEGVVFGLGVGPAGRVNERPAFQQILQLLTDLPARLITAAGAGNVPYILAKCVEVISPIRPPRNPVDWCIPGRGVNISSRAALA